MKKCKTCNRELSLDSYASAGIRDHPSYLRGSCKQCVSIKNSKDPEKLMEEKKYVSELHILQSEGKRKCRKCDTIKDLDSFPSDFSGKCHYDKKTYCKQCSWDIWRVPYAKTSKFKQLKSGWDKKYASKTRDIRNKLRRERYANDPLFKLRINLRNALGKYLRNSGVKKTKSALKLIGTDIATLKEHLENQFTVGMSWDNWATDGWHIDHIIPLSSFDLSDINEQHKAMHYTNLQPLWAKDNMSKGNKNNCLPPR